MAILSYLFDERKGGFMKTIKREFSSLLSIMITAMLVLGMMSGMLTLSASADGDNLPEVIGDAVLKYYDRYYYKAAYDVQGSKELHMI